MSITRIPSSFGAFSEIVVIPADGGTWIHISGQVGFDATGKAVVAGGVGAETAVIFDQIEQLLGEVGGGLEHVVKLNAFLTDLSTYGEFAAVRAERFADDPPASAAVGVADLLLGAGVEVDGVAFLPDPA
jgi:enamine deaminase RidA (YjgF/YER057c/UK114 family)